MSHLGRVSIGLTLRVITATAISLLIWWLSMTPFDRLPLPRSAIFAIVRILDFPVALAGELLYPIRGMELVFSDYDTWCDFCPVGEMFRQQMRLAIPVYLFLLYIPTAGRSIARRDRRLFTRIMIGLLIYTTVTTAYFLMTADGNRRADVRIAAVSFLILAAAAAFAWSPIERRWKIAGVAAVLLAGACALRFLGQQMDEVQPYYVSYLLLLIVGVGGTLWLTRTIEEIRR
jgi:hypothetical protein